MAAISITAANVLASSRAVTRTEYNFGTTITQGQLCYLDTSNLWQTFDNDSALGSGIATDRGIALNAGAAGQPARVVTSDPYFKVGGTLTKGLMVYGGNTAGAVTHDVPSAGQYTIGLGIAIDATYMNLQPVSAGVSV